MVKDQYPLAAGIHGPRGNRRTLGADCAVPIPRRGPTDATACGLTGTIAGCMFASSNTEPIVRVIAEAPEAAIARGLADQIGGWVSGTRDSQR